MTKFGDMLYQLGGLPVMAGIPFSRNAKYYFWDPATGSDGNSGLAPDEALATLAAAYAKCTANQHDTIFYIAGSTGPTLAAAITWAKNYTHLIGICAPSMTAQRARIHNEATTGITPLFNITASGCIFKNFYIFQGVNEAVANVNVQVSGGRNYFENVHFAGGGHASQAIDGGASLRLVGSEGENMFLNCTIGVDTILTATGYRTLAIIGGTPRNVFKDCHFIQYAGSTSAMFVEWEALSAVDRYMLFDNCSFINTGSSTMAAAFVIPASVPSHRRCFLKDCVGYGFGAWDANDRGVLMGNMNDITGADTSGVMVEMVS
jgi:hypothetical protein